MQGAQAASAAQWRAVLVLSSVCFTSACRGHRTSEDGAGGSERRAVEGDSGARAARSLGARNAMHGAGQEGSRVTHPLTQRLAQRLVVTHLGSTEQVGIGCGRIRSRHGLRRSRQPCRS